MPASISLLMDTHRTHIPTTRRNTPREQAVRGSTGGLPAFAAACLPVLLVGCGVFDGIQPGTPTLSAALFDQTSPEEAAELALDEYNPDNRYRGLNLIASSDFGGEELYVQLYRYASEDDDAGVRQAGIRALGMHGEPRDAEILITALDDPDRLVREEAARGLQRLHNPAAIDPLIDRLDRDTEREPGVRAHAAHALGQYQSERVLQALLGALEDPSLAVNSTTVHALTVLTGQNFGLDRTAWIDWMQDARGTDGGFFAAAQVYTYPGFKRPRHPVEYLPFVPKPRSHPGGAPVGLSPVAGAPSSLDDAPSGG